MSPPAEAAGPVSLRRLQRELIALLRDQDRADLARDALDRVDYTDDGSTLYVHILPQANWPRRQPGQAYVLAFADHDQLATLAEHRQFLLEAWWLLHDEIADIVKWLDGR